MSQPSRAQAGSLMAMLDARAEGHARLLHAQVRTPMERAFGASLGDVLVHTDPAAALTAARMGAQAYAIGRHVVFGPGRFDPNSPIGRALLAHELAHVLQQRHGGRRSGAADASSGPGMGLPAEVAADHAGALAAAGLPAAVSFAAPVGMARKATSEPVVVASVPVYEYRDEQGAVVRLTEQEYQEKRAAAVRRVREAITRLEGIGDVWRSTHARHLGEWHAESFGDIWHKPQRLIGVAANIWGDVVPPPLHIWDPPRIQATEARKALDAGKLAEAGRLLKSADATLRTAQKQWNDFLTATLQGAAKLKGDLEIVRDAAFAVEIGLAAAVAAPVIGSAAAAGAVSSMVIGGAMRGGTHALASRRTSREAGGAGETDVRGALKATVDPRGVVADAATGALAPGVGKVFGVGAKGLTVSQAMARQGAAAATTTAIVGVGETAADTTAALAVEGKTLERATEENLLPGLGRTGTSAGAAGVGGAAGALVGAATRKVAPVGGSLLGRSVKHAGEATVAAGTAVALGGDSTAAAAAALGTLAGATLPQPVSGRGTRATPRPSKRRVARAEGRLAAAAEAKTGRLDSLTKARGNAQIAAGRNTQAAIEIGEARAALTNARAEARTVWQVARRAARAAGAEAAQLPPPKAAGTAGGRTRKATPKPAAKPAAKPAVKAAVKAREAAVAADQAVVRAKQKLDRSHRKLAESARTLKYWTRAAERHRAKLTTADTAIRRARVRLRMATLPHSPARETRRDWAEHIRAEQAGRFGARSGEDLHHAIELQVLDRYPEAFAPGELVQDKNIRHIPAEVTTAEAQLLERARTTPREQWDPELTDRLEVHRPARGGADIVLLKRLPKKGRTATLHQGLIRRAWDVIYDRLDADLEAGARDGSLPEGSERRIRFIRNRIFEGRVLIDHLYGWAFGEARQRLGLR